jgi:membrane protease YdiL (CAAX protease family)
MKLLRPVIDALTGPRLKPTVILFLSSPLLLVWKYYCTPQVFATQCLGHLTTEQAASVGAVCHFLSCLLLLGVAPALLVKCLFRERLRDYGVGLGIPLRTLRTFLIFGPLFALCGYLASDSAAMRAVFPVNPQAGQSATLFALHAATYLLYYVGWEFYFRGFLLFGLRDSVGDVNAVLIQVLASSLLHIGSPASEAFGAVLGGLLWGILALRTRSLLSGLGQHFLLGITLDAAICFD